MMRIPIYRPEIISYTQDQDGLWVSRRGEMISTLFEPMPDEDGSERIAPGVRRVVKNGASPAFTVNAPEGSQLVARGRAWFLEVPFGKGTKLLDGIITLISAKRGEYGLRLEADPVPVPVVAQVAPVPPPAFVVRPLLIPEPAGRTRQLSMF